MSKPTCSFIITLQTILVLGWCLNCPRSSGANTGAVSTANEPGNVTPDVAQLKSQSEVPSLTRIAGPADPGAGRVIASPGQKSGNWKKLDNQAQKPLSNATTNTFKLRPPVRETAGLRAKAKEAQAARRAQAEVLVKPSQAEELRQQLRDSLRANRPAMMQTERETMVDAMQRADELKTKLLDHKEALDEASLHSKDRTRRGTDPASP